MNVLAKPSPMHGMQPLSPHFSFEGCYIDTLNPFPTGTLVQLRILRDQGFVETGARVVYSDPRFGMGLALAGMQPQQRTPVETWMTELVTQLKASVKPQAPTLGNLTVCSDRCFQNTRTAMISSVGWIMGLGTDLLNLRSTKLGTVQALMAGIDRLAEAQSDVQIMNRSFALNALGDAVLANVAVYALENSWVAKPVRQARRASVSARPRSRSSEHGQLHQRRLFA